MGWHEQGDGNHMLGVNIEQGRVRDTPELRMKSGFRAVVDNFEGVDMLLTPSQARPHSVVCARRVRAMRMPCRHAMPTCHCPPRSRSCSATSSQSRRWASRCA